MDGRFPHHPKSAAAIGELAEDLERECSRLDRLARASAEPMWGGVRESRVRRHTDQIMGRVMELAESIQEYGDAVADYDERVDRLNAAWAAERDRSFGVPPPLVDPDSSAAEVAAADQAHADQVWQARVEVARSLRAEYDRARAELDAAGSQVERAVGSDPATPE